MMMKRLRPLARLVLTAAVVSAGFALAACENLETMELFDTKRKLPG